MSDENIRLCIFGSCVTRDILALDASQRIDLESYFSRSSIISLMAPQPFDDMWSSQLKSPFQQRMVAADIKKTALPKLCSSNAKLLVLDLIDERFNLLCSSDGGVCTLSNELSQLNIERMVDGLQLVKSGSKKFLSLWHESFLRLVSVLEKAGKVKSLVLHKVYLASETESGEKFRNQDAIERQNQALACMYEWVEAVIGPEQVIRYPSAPTCPDLHKWGAAPFHFSDSSMKEALIQIYRRGDELASLSVGTETVHGDRCLVERQDEDAG